MKLFTRLYHASRTLLKPHQDLVTPLSTTYYLPSSFNFVRPPKLAFPRTSQRQIQPPFDGLSKTWTDHIIDLRPGADYSASPDIQVYLSLLGQLSRHQVLRSPTRDSIEIGRAVLAEEMEKQRGFFINPAYLPSRRARYGWLDVIRQDSLAEAARIKNCRWLVNLRRDQKKDVLNGNGWALRAGVYNGVLMSDGDPFHRLVKTNIRAPIPISIQPDNPRYMELISACYETCCNPIYLSYNHWEFPLETILSLSDNHIRSQGFLVPLRPRDEPYRFEDDEAADDPDWIDPKAVVGDWDAEIERKVAEREGRLPDQPWIVEGEVIP